MQYRPKPVEVTVQAVQWRGNNEEEVKGLIPEAGFARDGDGNPWIAYRGWHGLLRRTDWLVLSSDDVAAVFTDDDFQRCYEGVPE